METETTTQASAPAALAWLLPDRFHAWCDTCQVSTESDDTTARWCAVCGTRREQ